MTSALVLDASVLIAGMAPTDPHHVAARQLLRTGARFRSLLAHRITVAEAAVGATRSGRAEILRTAFAQLGIAVPSADEDEPWRLAELRAQTGLAIPDCCVLDAAITRGAALGTFDQRLATVAASRGIVSA